jgi:hypothetical protein
MKAIFIFLLEDSPPPMLFDSLYSYIRRHRRVAVFVTSEMIFRKATLEAVNNFMDHMRPRMNVNTEMEIGFQTSRHANRRWCNFGP